MQFVTDILVGILSTYLVFSNNLAAYITSIVTPDTASIEVTTLENNRAPRSLSTITSAYSAIPDILLQNATYQSANSHDAVHDSGTGATALEALVNIFCTYTTPEYIRATTGTGYFIHRDGIILTNAHVAQFLLLEEESGSTECIIRSGNPATPTYKADLLYIPPAWILAHADLIDAQRPQGTGERDYALLYVVGGLENKPMPRYFPSVSLETELMQVRAISSPVVAAGYPAEALFSAGDASAKLIPRQATTSITELMTFGSNYADIFTIAGSAIGEQGSSGGPIMNAAGDAIGLISTRGDDTVFGQGSLRAITMSYIDRTITEETGFTLLQNLGGNLPYRAKIFKEALVPHLRHILQNELAS